MCHKTPSPFLLPFLSISPFVQLFSYFLTCSDHENENHFHVSRLRSFIALDAVFWSISSRLWETTVSMTVSEEGWSTAGIFRQTCSQGMCIFSDVMADFTLSLDKTFIKLYYTLKFSFWFLLSFTKVRPVPCKSWNSEAWREDMWMYAPKLCILCNIWGCRSDFLFPSKS